MAQNTFGGEIPVIYAPIDFLGSVRNALLRITPDVMVFLETELWPTWVRQAHRMGIRTALINGRISSRSVEGYLRLRFFFREVLTNYDAFSMIMDRDAERIVSMGADSEKIEINGNAKYDLLAGSVDPAKENEVRSLLQLGVDDRVFVAGSTRSGEEEMVFDAYEKILERFPDTILVIAPRHIDRTPEIIAMIERRGLTYQLRTDLKNVGERREGQIVLLDTFGELFYVYSIATIVFLGGSLVPLGGQNPLEPAVWGKAAFYGPHMDNFLDAKAILEAVGAGLEVENSGQLAEKAIQLLSHPKELIQSGDRARQAVLRNKGAAEKHARVIDKLINA